MFENSNGADLAKNQYQSNSFPINHGWAEAVKSCRAAHRVLNQTFSLAEISEVFGPGIGCGNSKYSPEPSTGSVD